MIKHLGTINISVQTTESIKFNTKIQLWTPIHTAIFRIYQVNIHYRKLHMWIIKENCKQMCTQNKDLKPHTYLMILSEQIFQSENTENKIVPGKF